MKSHARLQLIVIVCAILIATGIALLNAQTITPRADAQSPRRAENTYQYIFPDIRKSCLEFCVGWAVGDHADGYGVILRTADSGASWQRQGQAGMIPDESTNGVSAVDAQNAWVVSDRTILRTRDGGATWETQMLPAGLPAGFSLTQVKALDNATAFVVGSPSVLLQTSNGGTAWSKMQIPFDLPAIRFSDVDAVSATHVWAVGGIITGTPESPNPRGGLAIAFYNGAQWQPQLLVPAGSGCNSFIGVSAVDATVGYAVGGEGCSPYKTLDGGATWQTAGAPLNPFDANRVVAVTRDLVWIGHDFGISRTTNGGATWELLATGCPSGGYCYAITAAGTRHAWASDLAFAPPGRLFRWVNADSWEMQTVPANSSVIIISFVGARR